MENLHKRIRKVARDLKDIALIVAVVAFLWLFDGLMTHLASMHVKSLQEAPQLRQ
jgi:hypothetical protein